MVDREHRHSGRGRAPPRRAHKREPHDAPERDHVQDTEEDPGVRGREAGRDRDREGGERDGGEAPAPAPPADPPRVREMEARPGEEEEAPRDEGREIAPVRLVRVAPLLDAEELEVVGEVKNGHADEGGAAKPVDERDAGERRRRRVGSPARALPARRRHRPPARRPGLRSSIPRAPGLAFSRSRHGGRSRSLLEPPVEGYRVTAPPRREKGARAAPDPRIRTRPRPILRRTGNARGIRWRTCESAPGMAAPSFAPSLFAPSSGRRDAEAGAVRHRRTRTRLPNPLRRRRPSSNRPASRRPTTDASRLPNTRPGVRPSRTPSAPRTASRTSGGWARSGQTAPGRRSSSHTGRARSPAPASRSARSTPGSIPATRCSPGRR